MRTFIDRQASKETDKQTGTQTDRQVLMSMAWHSGRMSVFGRRTFPVLRSTCIWRVTSYMSKLSAAGQPTQPFILSGSINSSKLQSDVCSGGAIWWMLTVWRPVVAHWGSGTLAGAYCGSNCSSARAMDGCI